MAKLPVKFLNIFGGLLSPGGNIAQFGSLAAGSPAFSNDPAVIQALTAWQNGMAPALINTSGGLASPALEDFNGILYVLTYMIAYLKQAGLAEWDPSVTYFTGSWANVGGVPYVSKTDNNTGNNPVGDTTNWQTFASTLLGASDPLIKAWVIFDGTTGAIDAQFNVASVSRVGAGRYIVNFATELAGTHYGCSGTAGTRPGNPFSPGDDNYITLGVPGATPPRSTTQCGVFCWDRPNNACEDSGMISLQFFGN